MVLRSVGYQSVPLPGVPFDTRASVVPNAQGRVLGEDGAPLPGEYVAGWLKRGPTGVIGTNKSDAAETVRCLLEDLAGGPGEGDVPLPRAGLLRYPDRPPPAADPLVPAADLAAELADPAAAAAARPGRARGRGVAAGWRARRARHRPGLLRRVAAHRDGRSRPGQGAWPRRAGQAAQRRSHLVRLPPRA